MSEEQLKTFLEKVKGDTSLQEKLKAAASPEAVIEIAKEAGFSITAEDIQSTQSATAELTEEELEAAAGGCRHATRNTHASMGCGPNDHCQQTALDGGTTTQWWCN